MSMQMQLRPHHLRKRILPRKLVIVAMQITVLHPTPVDQTGLVRKTPRVLVDRAAGRKLPDFQRHGPVRGRQKVRIPAAEGAASRRKEQRGVAAPEIRRNTRFDELLAIADSRLLYATSNGGNQVICNEAGSKQPTANTPAPEPVTPQILTDAAISKMINPTLETDDPARASIHAASGKSAQDADEAPAIKSLAEQDSCELPSLFAGPVPDLSTPEDPAESQGNTRTTATLNPAVFDFEHGEEDNIVITAPYGSHDPEDEASQPAESSANTAAAVFTEQAPARFKPHADSSGTRIPVIPVLADSSDDLELVQPGFFKRLFSPLARLFRRSG